MTGVHAEGAARRTVRTTYANYGTRIEHDNAHARLIADSEQALFAQAIQLAQGNQAKAARWLGVTRRTLRVKLAHFGLHPATTEQTTDTEQEA